MEIKIKKMSEDISLHSKFIGHPGKLSFVSLHFRL